MIQKVLNLKLFRNLFGMIFAHKMSFKWEDIQTVYHNRKAVGLRNLEEKQNQ